MFPTLPKRGTRLSQAERQRLSQDERQRLAAQRPPTAPQEPARPTGQVSKGVERLCDVCGLPSAKPKCGRCWAVVSGLASLKREHPAAFAAFVETLR